VGGGVGGTTAEQALRGVHVADACGERKFKYISV